ncbi:MAG: pilus assembly protein [Planctomycetaceae bacterium]|nr:pilus assembly protein [Planctomycetaceae bacterium]
MKRFVPASVSTSRRAAVAVEFAFVAPVIFLIFLAALELTAINLVRQTAGNAAYEAARKRIVAGSTSEDARREAERLLKAVCPARNVNISVQDEPDGVLVSISIPVRDNAWALGRFTGELTIEKQCRLTQAW